MNSKITIEIHNKSGNIIRQASGNKFVSMIYDRDYQPGDKIIVTLPENKKHALVKIDDCLEPALIHLPNARLEYWVPYGDELLGYPPGTFTGNRHVIEAREAEPEEIYSYRNIALNVLDQRRDTDCYPHVVANAETRGEAVFAARNTIDGNTANTSHGEWPYLSWGDDENPDAEITLFFGRKVEIDKMVLFLRADFPHDSYWKEITAVFSDGSSLKLYLNKTGEGQKFSFPTKQVEWIKLLKLVKADDPSPFPALSQWEVYGRDIR